MRLQRFIVLIVSITIISLIYVQLQIEIFKQAYKGGQNESRLNELLDDNSILMYNILVLESAYNVEDKLLSRQEDLQFAKRQQIAEVKIPLQVANKIKINLHSPKQRPNLFVRIFMLKSQAEAKQ